MNDCTDLHTVIGGELDSAVDMLFMIARAQYCTPASGPWIAFASAIGINNDVGQMFFMRHGANLLGLGLALGFYDFQQLGLIG